MISRPHKDTQMTSGYCSHKVRSRIREQQLKATFSRALVATSIDFVCNFNRRQENGKKIRQTSGYLDLFVLVNRLIE